MRSEARTVESEIVGREGRSGTLGSPLTRFEGWQPAAHATPGRRGYWVHGNHGNGARGNDVCALYPLFPRLRDQRGSELFCSLLLLHLRLFLFSFLRIPPYFSLYPNITKDLLLDGFTNLVIIIVLLSSFLANYQRQRFSLENYRKIGWFVEWIAQSGLQDI